MSSIYFPLVALPGHSLFLSPPFLFIDSMLNMILKHIMSVIKDKVASQKTLGHSRKAYVSICIAQVKSFAECLLYLIHMTLTLASYGTVALLPALKHPPVNYINYLILG